ncbi:MAG: hypothetical protein ACREFM_09200, partial [Hypericibacter sp.]
MAVILDFLGQSWLGAILGLLGLAFGVYQIYRRTGARLLYQCRGQKLIDGNRGLLPNSIVVHYDGKPVPRVSLSQIVIWNAGRAPVRGVDITLQDPLMFSFGDDAEILRVDIAKCTRGSIGPAVIIDDTAPGRFKCSFSFLDHHDGLLIRVIHTGNRTVPHSSGTIIGLPKGLEYFGRIPIPNRKLPRLARRSEISFADRVLY